MIISISMFLFLFPCFILSLPWELWLRLVCKYASFAFVVYVWPYLTNGEHDKAYMCPSQSACFIKVPTFSGFFGWINCQLSTEAIDPLRANLGIYRESQISSQKSNFGLYHPNNSLEWLFQKMILTNPQALYIWRI